jgi:hypothetical protein
MIAEGATSVHAQIQPAVAVDTAGYDPCRVNTPLPIRMFRGLNLTVDRVDDDPGRLLADTR